MNTFLPYKSFSKSASVLDNKRLGKQRVEVWQIYMSLTKPNYGWKNHPAVKMWKGYECALLDYGIAICEEWIRRGYRDSLLPIFQKKIQRFKICIKPYWLTNNFIRAHRSNLLRKDKKWYSQFHWNVGNDLPYIWPVK